MLYTLWVCQRNVQHRRRGAIWVYFILSHHYNHSNYRHHAVLSLLGGFLCTHSQPSASFCDHLNLMSIKRHSQPLLSHLKCSLYFQSNIQARFLLHAASFSGCFCGLSFLFSPYFPGYVSFTNLMFHFYLPCELVSMLGLSLTPWVMCHLLAVGTSGSWNQGSGYDL